MNSDHDRLSENDQNPLAGPPDDNYRLFLRQGFQVRGKAVANRLLLAPMAGLGHVAFRELVAEFGGCGLMFTGMLSAKALPHENPAVSPVFRWRQEELGFLVGQIFGPDPGSMALAAERIEKEGFFGVDLNFGCCVAAICKKGCGAALLKHPSLATTIVAQVRQAVDIPVFVKFRTGWEDNSDLAADMARRFEDAGADALVFHPRVAPDRRSRPPRWNHITRVRQAVSIPVFGNGNIFELNDGIAMLKLTGCHGLSVGRMAIASPWLFAQWANDFIPDKDIHHRTVLRMAQLLVKHHDPRFAVKLFKKFVPYFAANFRFGHAICKTLIKGETMDQILDAIETVFALPPETLARPNLNMFV
ncbi:MAG: tRNA-dihydrouridine synthase family protein [Pseudomonadota bacterium]